MKSSFAEFPTLNFKITWRPFQLNPKMPKEGMDRNLYLETKFGGKENALKTYKSINEMGLKNNIHFQFEKIKKTPNSFASHKLLALANKFDKQTEVVETIFYSYFIEGVDIGNLNELIKISKQHKIFDKNTENYLVSSEDKKSLLGEESHARELGIQGVPCFIVNKEIVLFGAQDKDNFVNIFKSIVNDN